MDTYFYCSYEHSQTGFFHTCLQGEELVPVEGGHSGLPEALGDFFSYDRFLLLWRDLSAPVERPWSRPKPMAGLFGLRSLQGRFADGRSGVVNMAFYASREELTLLRRTALAILGDFDSFQTRLFGWLRAGGPCGYQLEGRAFGQWVRDCGGRSRLRKRLPEGDPALPLLELFCRTQPQRLERDLLYLAVCNGSWQSVAQAMGNRANWYLKPRCVLTGAQFRDIFTGRGPLWEMEAGG